MSSSKLKATYNSEGTYGQTDKHTLYVHHCHSADTVTYYDHDGTFLMIVSSAVDRNLFDVINELYNPWDEKGNRIPGVEFWSNEDQELIKSKR